MKQKVRFLKLHKDTPTPNYFTEGAVGFDIAVIEQVTIEPHKTALISTGLVIEVPKGTALILAARSSVSKKGLMLANGIGIIDQDYCGSNDEIKLAIHNLTENPYITEIGERLAQGLLTPVLIAEFQETERLAKNTRGGFGSTDKTTNLL